APGGGFVGGGDAEDDVFAAGFGAEDEGEREARGGERRWRGGGFGDVAGAVGAQLEYRVPDRRHIAGRDQDFGEAGVGAVEGFEAQIAGAAQGIGGAADLGRRQRRVQADE